MKKIILLMTAVLFTLSNIIAQTPPTTSWNDFAETAWYNTTDVEFNITSAEELAGLAILVNAGNNFSGKKINIQTDLNLASHLWTPIGATLNKPFSGEFDGNNHTISNLFVNSPETNLVGLFGRCVTAILSNIRIETPYIRGEDSAGALVGNFWKNGSIENCHATGVNLISSGDNVGGLVGDLVEGCSLRRCSAEGNVTGNSQVGGLLGSPYNGNTITESYSEGTVTGNHIAGGFTGASVVGFPGTTNSTIENCYSRANVTVFNGMAGGFIGSFSALLEVNNSYSTGTAVGPEFIGGFIGAAGGVISNNNFWDAETSLLSNAVGEWIGGNPGTPDITARNTIEMKTTEFLDLLNEGGTVWKLNSTENDGYPFFSVDVVATNNIGSINSNVVIYPNVFDTEINIDSEKALKNYAIYAISGKEIQAGSLEGKQALVNTAGIHSGIYVLIIQTESETISKNIIK